MIDNLVDRVLAMDYLLTRDALSDPPAFALLVACGIACLIVVGVGWHYLCRACAAKDRRATPAARRPAPARADRPADSHTRTTADLHACEQTWTTSPSLRARIIARAREHSAIRRARRTRTRI